MKIHQNKERLFYEYPVEKMERQATDQEKIIVSTYSTKTYIEYIKKKNYQKSTTTPPKFNYNMCKELNRYFTKGEICKAKHMKRFSTSLAIWEIQIKN